MAIEGRKPREPPNTFWRLLLGVRMGKPSEYIGKARSMAKTPTQLHKFNKALLSRQVRELRTAKIGGVRVEKDDNLSSHHLRAVEFARTANLDSPRNLKRLNKALRKGTLEVMIDRLKAGTKVRAGVPYLKNIIMEYAKESGIVRGPIFRRRVYLAAREGRQRTLENQIKAMGLGVLTPEYVREGLDPLERAVFDKRLKVAQVKGAKIIAAEQIDNLRGMLKGLEEEGPALSDREVANRADLIGRTAVNTLQLLDASKELKEEERAALRPLIFEVIHKLPKRR